MEHYETVTINSRPSRSLSAEMLEKEIKIFQPKELSRKRDSKKSEGAIIKDEKNMWHTKTSYFGCGEYFFFKPIAAPNWAARGNKASGSKVLMQFPSSEFCQAELEIFLSKSS